LIIKLSKDSGSQPTTIDQNGRSDCSTIAFSLGLGLSNLKFNSNDRQ
jgi:hypothetical protein